MKSRILLTGFMLISLPCLAYSARFVLMTPETNDQADYQPWLYHALKAPETVIVAVPYHKGDKQYWLVRTNRILSDIELNLRTIIHSQNSRALPGHIQSVSKLATYDPTEASGNGEAIGIIYVRIRHDALKNYYLVHDFPEGVDDGGDYRTYKLSAYAIDSFELGQDRISEYFKLHHENQDGVEDQRKPIKIETEGGRSIIRISVDWSSAERLMQDRVVSSVSIDSKGVALLYNRSKHTTTIFSVEKGNVEKVSGLLEKLNAKSDQSWSSYPMWDVASMKVSYIESGMEWNDQIEKGLERDLATAKREAKVTTFYHLDSTPNPTHREQAGTGQPATRPESKPEGSDKPQTESEGRSR